MSTTDSSDSHKSLKERVQHVIDRIRPAVQGDGGDIELVDVVGDTVKIRFHGACHGCPSSTMTLQYGIERNIREKIPEVKAVIPVA
ncbi:MAG: NifU family protein [Phycisphaerae bacterium]|jgi:Fe-S cluster biogenesis protein NfuA|nr:MAG: NifU family protein [Phycisphaerae bacterium]